jgi:hypothetical protein
MVLFYQETDTMGLKREFLDTTRMGPTDSWTQLEWAQRRGVWVVQSRLMKDEEKRATKYVMSTR